MGSNVTYRGPDDLPGVIPVFPLAGALLLPRGTHAAQHLRAALPGDDRRRAEGRAADRHDPARRDAQRPRAARPALYSVGCVGRITQLAETGDGRYLVTLTGIARFR